MVRRRWVTPMTNHRENHLRTPSLFTRLRAPRELGGYPVACSRLDTLEPPLSERVISGRLTLLNEPWPPFTVYLAPRDLFRFFYSSRFFYFRLSRSDRSTVTIPFRFVYRSTGRLKVVRRNTLESLLSSL